MPAGNGLTDATTEHAEFVRRYQAGEVRLGIVRTRLGSAAHDEILKALLSKHDHPSLLERLATLCSLLAIPALAATLILPAIFPWWTFVFRPLAALAFSRQSYRYKREAVKELAVADAGAYKILMLRGVIVVDEAP